MAKELIKVRGFAENGGCTRPLIWSESALSGKTVQTKSHVSGVEQASLAKSTEECKAW